MSERVNRKVTAEEVAALAAERLPNSEIARRLGVSKQRVSQIAKANGIEIRKIYYTEFWEDQRQNHRAAVPRPRLRTGGVYVTENGDAVGSVSELLAAADLIARGWHVYLPFYRRCGHDLIAYSGGHFLTIEVRSGHTTKNGGTIYQKTTNRTKSSHFAVVITGEPVRYIPNIPEADQRDRIPAHRPPPE